MIMSQFKNRFGIIKAILILVVPIILGLFPTERAIACSCVIPGTPEQELKKFDAVFMGTVTSISERIVSDDESTETSLFDPVKVGIKVGQSWKGVTNDFVYAYTGYGSGDCGYPVTGFETYLFYASGPMDELSISICSRTALYREAQEDRRYLEQLHELPLTHVVYQNDSIEDSEDGVIILLAGSTIVLFAVVSYLLVKNQRARSNSNQ